MTHKITIILLYANTFLYFAYNVICKPITNQALKMFMGRYPLWIFAHIFTGASGTRKKSTLATDAKLSNKLFISSFVFLFQVI